jgi:uncharacterized membrane protein
MTIQRTNRYLIAGLVVSVAVNLVMGGFIIGRLNHPGQMVRAGMMGAMVKIAQKLPAEDRDLLKSALKTAKPDLEQAMENRRQAQQSIKTALMTEPFDNKQFQAGLDQLSSSTDQGRDRLHDMILDLAPRFSPEGRKIIAQMRSKDSGQNRRALDMIESKLNTP